MRPLVLLLLLLPTANAIAQCIARLTLAQDLVYPTSAIPLTQIRDMAVSSSGVVALADDGMSLVVMLTPDGRSARQWGRPGNGPGEFRKVSNIRFRGDSLWVMDSRLQRATVFTSSGVVARTNIFSRFSAGIRIGQTYPFGDHYVTMPFGTVTDAMNPGYRVPIVVVDFEGTVQDSINGPLMVTGNVMAINLPGDGTAFDSYPTPRIDKAVVAPNGKAILIARGEVKGNGQRSFTLTSVSVRRDTLFSRRIDAPNAPVPADFSRAKLDSTVLRYVKQFPTRAEAVRAVERVWKTEDHFWPVESLVVGTDGRTWVRTSPLDDTWLVVSSDGRSVACAQVPRGVNLHAASGEYAWGVRVDDNDVPSILRFRVR